MRVILAKAGILSKGGYSLKKPAQVGHDNSLFYPVFTGVVGEKEKIQKDAKKYIDKKDRFYYSGIRKDFITYF